MIYLNCLDFHDGHSDDDPFYCCTSCHEDQNEYGYYLCCPEYPGKMDVEAEVCCSINNDPYLTRDAWARAIIAWRKRRI